MQGFSLMRGEDYGPYGRQEQLRCCFLVFGFDHEAITSDAESGVFPYQEDFIAILVAPELRWLGGFIEGYAARFDFPPADHEVFLAIGREKGQIDARVGDEAEQFNLCWWPP